MKAAVIGDEDTIAMFQMAGIAYGIDDPTKFDEIADNDDFALLLITDVFAEQLKEKIVHHRLTKNLPIIIEIPGKHKIEREDTIKKLIMRAVGVEVE